MYSSFSFQWSSQSINVRSAQSCVGNLSIRLLTPVNAHGYLNIKIPSPFPVPVFLSFPWSLVVSSSHTHPNPGLPSLPVSPSCIHPLTGPNISLSIRRCDTETPKKTVPSNKHGMPKDSQDPGALGTPQSVGTSEPGVPITASKAAWGDPPVTSHFINTMCPRILEVFGG